MPFHSFFAIVFPTAEHGPRQLKRIPKVNACLSLFTPLSWILQDGHLELDPAFLNSFS